MKIDRRRFLRLGAGALALGRWGVAAGGARQELPVIGSVTARASKEIAASPLSVGFETLDRRMFDPERTYPHLAKLGVKWARVQTGWARTETVKGRYDFAWLDKVVENLLAIGIQPWFCLSYGNSLYTPAPDRSAVGAVPLNSPEATSAWLAFTEALARRFARRVRHWEIWNEPNISKFWRMKGQRPEDYVKLVQLTVPRIRQQVPDAVIIGGALAGMPSRYLRACLERGLGKLVQKISYHPYRKTPEANYEGEVAAFRRLVATHKPAVKLWQGENGCPSRPGGAGALANLPWTEERQAEWLTRRILGDLRLGVELTSYFHTVDLVNYNWGAGRSGKTNYKGLLRGRDYSRKPAYFAYQRLCALFDSQTRLGGPPVRVVPDRAQTETVTASFLRGDGPLVAYWCPADLTRDFAEQRATVGVKTDKALELVLVNPLAGEIHGLAAPGARRGELILGGLPLRDYPLLLAERSAVL